MYERDGWRACGPACAAVPILPTNSSMPPGGLLGKFGVSSSDSTLASKGLEQKAVSWHAFEVLTNIPTSARLPLFDRRPVFSLRPPPPCLQFCQPKGA